MSLARLGKIFDRNARLTFVDECDVRAYQTDTLVSWVVKCALLSHHLFHEAYPDGFDDKFLGAFSDKSFLGAR